MIRENISNSTEDQQTFLRKKTTSSSSSFSIQNSGFKSRSRTRLGSEESSMVSTRDLNSSFEDFSTVEAYHGQPAYHESLFAQSIFSNGKSQEDSNDFEQLSHSFLYYDSLPSDNDLDEEPFQFIGFSNKLNDNCFEGEMMISPQSFVEEPEQTSQARKKKQVQFKITKKGRKKLSTKPRKINKALPPRIQCGHCNCSNSFYTDKQHARHHNKFSPLCTKDSVALIKLVAKTKRILHHLYNPRSGKCSPLQSIKDKYEKFVGLVPQRDQFNYISGSQFDDCLTEDDEDDQDECTSQVEQTCQSDSLLL